MRKIITTLFIALTLMVPNACNKDDDSIYECLELAERFDRSIELAGDDYELRRLLRVQYKEDREKLGGCN